MRYRIIKKRPIFLHRGGSIEQVGAILDEADIKSGVRNLVKRGFLAPVPDDEPVFDEEPAAKETKELTSANAPRARGRKKGRP